MLRSSGEAFRGHVTVAAVFDASRSTLGSSRLVLPDPCWDLLRRGPARPAGRAGETMRL